MTNRAISLLLALVLPAALLSADVTFADPDVSTDNQLLFRSVVGLPGYGSYDTLFHSDLEERTVTQLTFFPEQVSLLRGGSILQIQNRFGVFRSGTQFQGMTTIDHFPSFVRGSLVQNGKIIPMQTSPDGRYLLYLRPTSEAYGDLVLHDLSDSSEHVVSRSLELSLQGPPSTWAPDATALIYARRGGLYYFSIAQYREDRVLSEGFRKLGEGQIANVRWGRGSVLYYIWDTLVFQVDSREFFTRALYSGFLKAGRIVGKIPFAFDPNFDSFWIAPDGARVLLNKGGRNLILYVLSDQDFHSTGDSLSLPYLFLPRNTRVKRVVWSSSNIITVLTSSIVKGELRTAVYRLSISSGNSAAPAVFGKTADQNVQDIVLGPSESSAAVLGTDGVGVYHYATWKEILSVEHPNPLHALWVDDTRFIVAGAHRTEIVDRSSGAVTLITVSQPGSFGFGAEDGAPTTTAGGSTSNAYDEAVATWESIDSYDTKARSVVADSYRVYLEPYAGSIYRNMVMVRDIKGFGTRPLVASRGPTPESFPETEESSDFDNFSHGSRIRRREIALVFNGIDSIEGLTTILNALAELI